MAVLDGDLTQATTRMRKHKTGMSENTQAKCSTHAQCSYTETGSLLVGERNGEFFLCSDLTVLVAGSVGRVTAVSTADMLSRSRCFTRSVGRSISALRQVCTVRGNFSVLGA